MLCANHKLLLGKLLSCLYISKLQAIRRRHLTKSIHITSLQSCKLYADATSPSPYTSPPFKAASYTQTPPHQVHTHHLPSKLQAIRRRHHTKSIHITSLQSCKLYADATTPSPYTSPPFKVASFTQTPPHQIHTHHLPSKLQAIRRRHLTVHIHHLLSKLQAIRRRHHTKSIHITSLQSCKLYAESTTPSPYTSPPFKVASYTQTPPHQIHTHHLPSKLQAIRRRHLTVHLHHLPSKLQAICRRHLTKSIHITSLQSCKLYADATTPSPYTSPPFKAASYTQTPPHQVHTHHLPSKLQAIRRRHLTKSIHITSL